VLRGGAFRRREVFNFMIKYLAPVFAGIILLSSIANAFGLISM
jgi:NSS family neurotransmitter:Na+ symporter